MYMGEHVLPWGMYMRDRALPWGMYMGERVLPWRIGSFKVDILEY